MPAERRGDESGDQFPLGMRVLAVDDDPTCLRLLETLLRKCQYHVTTTSQAVKALKLLRENKDKFDLVISDVRMPDMDGFKLLELVGLEMELPVIMLSAYGDTKLVMKGITHGACDYLLKPVRLEELKNIWQHVIRKRKANPEDRNVSNNEVKNCGFGERNKATGMKNHDHEGKTVRKRKDQNEEEEEEYHENGTDNDDASNQKKQRVVWCVDLHRKFVAAVNAIGFDKAVPKKILELMNDDRLTRENVASHLQKYRLYLKRLSEVSNQQANMAAALGASDPAYLPVGAANFHDFNSSLQLQNTALRSIPTPGPSRMLERMNAPGGLLGLHGLSPSGVISLDQAHIPRSSIDGSNKFEPGSLPDGNILQGMPTLLDFDQLQHKDTARPGDLLIANGNSMFFPKSTSNHPINGARNSILSHSSVRSTVLEANHKQVQTPASIVNRSPMPNLPGLSGCNNNWASAAPSTAVRSTPFASSDVYQPAFHGAVGPRDNIQTRLCRDIPLPSLAQNSRLDAHCQGTLLGNNIAQETCAPSQGWENPNLNIFRQPDFIDGMMNSNFVAAHAAGPTSPGTGLNGSMDFGTTQPPVLVPYTSQRNIVEQSASVQAAATNMKQGYLADSRRSFGGYPVNGSGSLEDVVTAMVKREPDGSATNRCSCA